MFTTVFTSATGASCTKEVSYAACALARFDVVSLEQFTRGRPVHSSRTERTEFRRIFRRNSRLCIWIKFRPESPVKGLGSRIDFRIRVLWRPAPKRGIPSDSFSDSYGDFRG
jgi:hypothetical protein